MSRRYKQNVAELYILLTVHHIMILGKWPTWRPIFFYVFIYILTLYMFRAHRAHHQERQIVSIPLVAVTLCQWPCCVQVGSSLLTCTWYGHRQLPEVVLTQFVSPDDEHNVLETCRELKYKQIHRKNCASR